MHNGIIRFHSEEQKGTEFIIELPIKTVQKETKKTINNENNSYKKVEILNIELSDIYE